MNWYVLIGLVVQVVVLLVAVAVSWGGLKARDCAHAEEIRRVRKEVEKLSDGFTLAFVRRETLDVKFEEINRRFDDVDESLQELRSDVASVRQGGRGGQQ